MAVVHSYQLTIYAMGAMVLLMLVQVLVADIVGIKFKHIPGSAIESNHANLLFRVSRVVDNTNETIAILVLALMFCILSNASPAYTAYSAWCFVVARFFYALCYYGNVQMMRSIFFVVSLLCLGALLLIGVVT